MALAAAVAGCAPHPVSTLTPPAPPTRHVAAERVLTATALARPAAPLASYPGFADADLPAALAAFRASCPAMLHRHDISGLTQPGDWAVPCAAASAGDARKLFTAALVPVIIGDGRGLDTGYYEPVLAAALTPSPRFTVPLYRRPPDLVDVDLGMFDNTLTGKHIRGRVADGRLVPYYDRGEIDAGALAGRGLELAWAADPDAAFFLEIQGSGRLVLSDGTLLRIGYDGQNGHAYTGIGKLLRDRGSLGPGQATMAGIIAWLRTHPAEAPAIRRANRSKVFFKRLTTPADQGPPGALGVPLTSHISVAADAAFVPLGAPLWLDTTVASAAFRTVAVAQDTGGAIRGANRLDLFWGSGDAAGAVAGGIASTGTVTLLLPAAAAARLFANDAAAPTHP